MPIPEDIKQKWLGYKSGTFEVVGFKKVKGTLTSFKLILRCECGLEIEYFGRALKYRSKSPLRCVCSRLKSQQFEKELLKIDVIESEEIDSLILKAVNEAVKIIGEKDPKHKSVLCHNHRDFDFYIGDQKFGLTAYAQIVKVPPKELSTLLHRGYPLVPTVEFLKKVWFEKQQFRWQLRNSVNPETEVI